MKKYRFIFISLLLIEILIALFSTHPFIRGFVGDVLVIPLLYTLIRSFINGSMITILLCVLGIAFIIELLQFFSITETLSIKSKILRTVLGDTFDLKDLVAYLVGGLGIYILEKKSWQAYSRSM